MIDSDDEWGKEKSNEENYYFRLLKVVVDSYSRSHFDKKSERFFQACDQWIEDSMMF